MSVPRESGGKWRWIRQSYPPIKSKKSDRSWNQNNKQDRSKVCRTGTQEQNQNNSGNKEILNPKMLGQTSLTASCLGISSRDSESLSLLEKNKHAESGKQTIRFNLQYVWGFTLLILTEEIFRDLCLFKLRNICQGIYKTLHSFLSQPQSS